MDYLTNSRSPLFAPIQAWNLGVSFGRSKITAQTIVMLSVQDFSNILQTICYYIHLTDCIPLKKVLFVVVQAS